MAIIRRQAVARIRNAGRDLRVAQDGKRVQAEAAQKAADRLAAALEGATEEEREAARTGGR